jgi:hypothetical protein
MHSWRSRLVFWLLAIPTIVGCFAGLLFCAQLLAALTHA